MLRLVAALAGATTGITTHTVAHRVSVKSRIANWLMRRSGLISASLCKGLVIGHRAGTNVPLAIAPQCNSLQIVVRTAPPVPTRGEGDGLCHHAVEGRR